MNLLVIGFGYSAQRFVDLYGSGFARVTGTVRGADKRAQLARYELDLFDGTAPTVAALAAAAEADVVLISAPPGPGDDPALTRFGDAVTHGRARRVVYLSTVGVYGDHQGAWIDEDTPLAPEHDRVQARVRVEEDWRGRIGDRLAVLRLGGIYGPGRNALVELRAGRARRIVKPGQVFNRIHVDDIAGAIMGAIRREAGGAWNIVDDEPAPPQDVVAYAAGLMGIAPPPEQPFDRVELSPMAKSFYASNRRIRNTRAKQDLGLVFAYPTYRAGLDALWAAGEGRS